jgi:hypothetical protein
MPASGHRFPLLLYTYILNRWWRAVLAIGILLLVMAAGLRFIPQYAPRAHFLQLEAGVLWAVGGIGTVAIFAAIFLIAIRKSAYVQPFSDHLRLVTPFLRLNISYRRIRQATSIEARQLFQLGKTRGWRRSFLLPLAGQTAIILDLAGYPLSPTALRLFLSPDFFPDKSPRLALLVRDWMGFSAELESFRGSWMASQRQPGHSGAATLINPLDRKS